HCHCSMCRKFHGAAFATIGSVPVSAFRWTKGENELQGYSANNDTTRTFCRNCGSSLQFASSKADSGFREIALGCVDDDLPIEPKAHIFVADSAKWTKICDGLPTHPKGALVKDEEED
ncbi:MAG: hypothetical protein ACI9FD_004113, partial [Gammaproteobacteria bacterium]